MSGKGPETLEQAWTWDKVKNRYLRAGLCITCASQAAWGHQCGFANVHPPCEKCRHITLPADLLRRHGDRGAKWLAYVPSEPW